MHPDGDRPGVAAVLFDMDGTLVDSDASVRRAWVSWCGEYGVPIGVADAFVRGSSAAEGIRRIFPELEAESLAERVARFLDYECADVSEVVPMPGAFALLARLGALGIPWAIVTSAERPLAALRLKAAGVVAETVVTIDDVAACKPDPEGYLLAARTLGIDISRCLVVEDSVPGVAAGRAAGARVASLRGVASDLPLRDLFHLAELLTAPAGDQRRLIPHLLAGSVFTWGARTIRPAVEYRAFLDKARIAPWFFHDRGRGQFRAACPGVPEAEGQVSVNRTVSVPKLYVPTLLYEP
jgi:mannitol-1-/sugar-/sorbitol-6-phosphatase